MVGYASMMLVFLTCFVMFFEAFAAFTAIERAENAARTGARVAARQGSLPAGEAAIGAALPGWLRAQSQYSLEDSGDGFIARVSFDVPLLWSNAPLDITIDREVEMPNVG
ncbi:pilus assembly protein TadE [Allonocardiopsis opalescens]|uniref:TadE-like protein n=1 Tax=Allonocardiopsis opalescens TaxID=1144618 RepID=A0A2T0PVC8_9ACTN|nr:pilus assembly protein TadE [Allonocardiopsis opalescens]PRX95495.1 hypothetical protein CLV72_109104 [Allonocardiopsis opalescens]